MAKLFKIQIQIKRRQQSRVVRIINWSIADSAFWREQTPSLKRANFGKSGELLFPKCFSDENILYK